MIFLPERRRSMEQTREREWKSLVCPEGKERAAVMLEWDVVSEKGRILKRVLKQIDCHSPELTLFGGADCDWKCEGVITKRER
jgi:hypothetical protein